MGEFEEYIFGSHFILGGINYYPLASKNKYNVLIAVILCCKTLLLLLRWDTGTVRVRFGGMGGFKGGLRCEGWINSVIINVITDVITYRYFFKYSVKTCVQNKCIVPNY